MYVRHHVSRGVVATARPPCLHRPRHWLRLAGGAVLLCGLLAHPVEADCHCWYGTVHFTGQHHYHTYQGTHGGSYVETGTNIGADQSYVNINQDNGASWTYTPYYPGYPVHFNIVPTCDTVTWGDNLSLSITHTGTYTLSGYSATGDTWESPYTTWATYDWGVYATLTVDWFGDCQATNDTQQDVNIIQAVDLTVNVKNFAALTGETVVVTDTRSLYDYTTSLFNTTEDSHTLQGDMAMAFTTYGESEVARNESTTAQDTPVASDKIDEFTNFHQGQGDYYKNVTSQNKAVDKLTSGSVGFESMVAFNFSGGDNADIDFTSYIGGIWNWPSSVHCIPLESMRGCLAPLRDALKLFIQLGVWLMVVGIVWTNLIGIKIGD